MTDQFPKMLYRPGEEYLVFDKHRVDTKIVKDAEDFGKAIAEGWSDDPSATPLHPYQEGGDPPDAEGGYPVDHQWDKGYQGERGKATRFENLEEYLAIQESIEENGPVSPYTLSEGNPPRWADPTVPGPAAKTEGADELKKHPGEHTRKAEEEFARQADEEAEKQEKRGPGRPRKTVVDEAAPARPMDTPGNVKRTTPEGDGRKKD